MAGPLLDLSGVKGMHGQYRSLVLGDPGAAPDVTTDDYAAAQEAVNAGKRGLGGLSKRRRDVHRVRGLLCKTTGSAFHWVRSLANGCFANVASRTLAACRQAQFSAFTRVPP